MKCISRRQSYVFLPKKVYSRLQKVKLSRDFLMFRYFLLYVRKEAPYKKPVISFGKRI